MTVYQEGLSWQGAARRSFAPKVSLRAPPARVGGNIWDMLVRGAPYGQLKNKLLQRAHAISLYGL